MSVSTQPGSYHPIPATPPLELGRVGESVRKVDAIPKVTGEFAYASDLFAAGMLHGRTVRSPHAHARLLGVDTEAARSLPGVHAVLTHADVPGEKHYGLEFRDQPVLAFDRVRFFGEPVAVVAAEEPEQARRAAETVAVEYEPLEPIADPEMATQREPLHPDRPTMGHGRRDDPRPNVVRSILVRHGDPDAAGEVAVEGVYELGTQDQAFLGPEAGLAVPDGEGGVDIHVATQWLHVDRDQIAPCLALPPELVRVHLAGVGGAFGGREDLSMQIHGAMLALATGRPVRMVYSRDESFIGHVHRHPARIRMEHRASREGELVCVRAEHPDRRRRVRVELDGRDRERIGVRVRALPRPERADRGHRRIHEQPPVRGDARLRRGSDAASPSEAQMDGSRPRSASTRSSCGSERALARRRAPDRAADHGLAARRRDDPSLRGDAAPDPEHLPRDPIRLPGGAGNTTRGEGVRRGVGFAVGFKNICYSEGFDDYTAARIRLFADGAGELVAEIHCAAAEVGQGVTNVMLQVARTELDVAHVALAPHSTATVGSAGSSSASRQTWMTAGAVRLACRAAAEELERRGGVLAPGDEIDVERVYRHAPTAPLDPETGRITSAPAHVAFACAAMRVVVEVDVELGLTRVVWIGTAQDVGRALNPTAVHGQIAAGAAQGLGLALMEELQTHDGLITNASFTDYLIPTALDMPAVVAELVEEPEPDAPYGVKGVGEPPTVVSTAAIVAALRDATGRELSRVPVRPDDIAL